jgi:hypothetical protein
MYQLHTPKQKKYFDEVIRLHFEKGYGTHRISHVLPITKTTAFRWITIFAKEKGEISGMNMKEKPQKEVTDQVQSEDVKALKKRIKELEAQVLHAELKAEFYDEMINVAEAQFKIQIRKKAGAKQ